MHGQIGDIRDRAQQRGDLHFYYRTREALMEARRLDGGMIDYDFYRRRARIERKRALKAIFRSLWPYVRPLVAIVALSAAIYMLPWPERSCPTCVAPVAHHYSLTSNR